MILYVIHKEKFKYRILSYNFPTAPILYFAQYKIFGIWMYIGTNRGHLTHYSNKTYCESYEIALDRIKIHKRNIRRANEWAKHIKEEVININ
jgi:hypothetical protein